MKVECSKSNQDSLEFEVRDKGEVSVAVEWQGDFTHFVYIQPEDAKKLRDFLIANLD